MSTPVTDEQIIQRIQSSQDIASESKIGYVRLLKKLAKDLGCSIHGAVVGNPQRCLKHILSTGKSKFTINNLLTACLAVFCHAQCENEAAQAMYKTELRQVASATDESYKENKPTRNQASGFVPFDEICSMRDRLTPGCWERLILCFYTYIPPLRADFNAVQIVTSEIPKPSSPNYIVIGRKNAHLVLNEYKTAKIYGTKRERLSGPLVAELLKSLELMPRRYLFVNKAGKPYTPRAYSEWVNSRLLALFGKPLKITLLRHSFVTQLYKNIDKTTDKQLERIAHRMCHSFATQRKYRFVDPSMFFDNVDHLSIATPRSVSTPTPVP